MTLIDYLLEHKEINTNRLKSAMHYISHNFEQSEDFFTAYFITGKHNAELIRYLSGEWPGFASAAISSQHGAEQIAYILKFVEAEYVCENMNTENLLTNYLSEKGHHVLASDLPLPDNYNVLKRLNVRFHDLLSLEKNHALLEFVHKECLYIITVENVHYVLQAFTDAKDVGNIKAEKANYTSILAVGSEQLKKYIEENLAYYLEEVFLSLPDNSEESETAIKILLNQEKLKSDHKTKIISKQNYIFENFEGIPENLWFHLLQKEKVAISWKNISEYLGYKDNDKSVVTSLLGRQNVIDTLSKLEFSITELGKDNSSILSYFIIQNDELKNTDYCQLIKCLPYSYTNFPKLISEEKQVCLARERKVRLTEDSFRFLEKNNQLVAILISKNFDTYQKDKKKYPIDDDIRELLLSSKINNKDKLTVCLDVTPNGAVENKHLSLLVANFLLSNEVDCSQFDDTVLSSAIINAQTSSDSIQLLMKCLLTWDEKKTMEVLAELPEPFSEISSYGKRPKIDKNQINLKFARLLKTKGFISSLREGKNSLKINTFKSSIHA